jgi:hypothetical protein
VTRAPWVAVGAVLLVVTLAGAALAAFTSGASNPQTLTAASPFPSPSPTVKLEAQSRSNDGGASGSQIQFGLNLVNAGTSQVDLSTVTMRYWFLNDGGGDSIVSACYYATFGCDKLTLGITTVRPERVKADRYLQVSFTQGSLGAGAAAALDQLALRDQSGGTFHQSSDYSFLNKASFTDNPAVTVYVGGKLAWGTEPDVAPIVTSVEVKYANLDGNDHDQGIKPGLRIENTGTTDIDLSHVTVRYWFTKDSGDGTFQGFCDYAEIGCGEVRTSFGAVSPGRPGADSYLQVSFGGGKAVIGGSTGVLQLRFNKTDYSNFDETDDYSHGSNTTYAVTPKVTAYLDGTLIWGTEP